MLVVADTSPLNCLVWIQPAEILPGLYGRVLIPPEVREKLHVPEAPEIVRSWAAELPTWIEVAAPEPAPRDNPRWQSLDLGERAALELAVARQPSVILIEERTGAPVARNLGLLVAGALGVLDEASRRGLIPLPKAIAQLKEAALRYPQAPVERLLENDARRLAGRKGS